MTMQPGHDRIVLCILDGWGIDKDGPGNAISKKAWNWQRFLHGYPSTKLKASEEAVGLPKGQMGNSEVGHMSIGLGRVTIQDLPRIDQAIEDDKLKSQPAVQTLLQKLHQTKGTCHVMGLLSDGGVHSHQRHLFAALNILKAEGIPTQIHAFLDGRDTSPQSALSFLERLQPFLNDTIHLVTLSGRYYAMDRDQRWLRTQLAYRCITQGETEHHFSTPQEAIHFFYNQGIYDEFIPPCTLGMGRSVQVEDGLWTFNFRADRMRQLLSALILPDFSGFDRGSPIQWASAISMTDYAASLIPWITPVFPKISLHNGLGEVIAKAHQRQIRIAETEKYAHVTFFFNGGREAPFPEEDRILVPSPAVATYDLQPEMSARALTEAVLHVMKEKRHQLVVINYANTDMVGHSGCLAATQKAVEVVDRCLEKLEKAAKEHNWLLVITADHGNAEHMLNPDHTPHTAHTCNLVPFILIGAGPRTLKTEGTLCDIAPTILELLRYPCPPEMTGRSLLVPA